METNTVPRVPKVMFKRMSDDAILPTKGSKQAVGFDIYADADCTIIGGQGTKMIPSGIAVMIPEGYYGRIAMRSGLAIKEGLAVSGGVIDRDYRGEIKVITFCTRNDHSYTVRKGDRIAQLVIEKAFYGEAVEVSELPETERGSDGFGSSGR